VPKLLPGGAYYLFVGYRNVPGLKGMDPRTAAMEMTVKYKVACVPGDNFYLSKKV
jgi:aspartate/methionine/tyrosine aminotransferase